MTALPMPRRGQMVFVTLRGKQWPFLVTSVMSRERGSVNGWAFTNTDCHPLGGVLFSDGPREDHWQYALVEDGTL